VFKKYRFLLARRFVQFALIALYGSANWYGLKALRGNMSESLLMGKVPLTDPYAVLQIFCTGTIVGFDALIGAAIIAIFYALIGGRAFCSFVCPINLVTDLANFARRWLRFDEVERKVFISRSVRYWVLALGLILSFITGVAAYEIINPIGILSRGLIYGIGFGFAVVIGVFLFDMFALKNGFCGHICPVGGFYAIIGKYRLLKVKHDSEKCSKCMNCVAVCPEKQVLYMVGKESRVVDNSECTNCGRCIEVCNDDALHFSLTAFSK
jgi:ferredoxin-type protein NapH